MPKSLRCKIKHLCHNGTLSEKERDRILKALEQEPCDNCISREHAKQFLYYEIERLHDDGLYDCFSRIIDDMYNELPSVTPQASEEDIHREREQAYMLGYEDASKKFRTEPCEDCISRAEAIEKAIDAVDEWDGGCNKRRAEMIEKALKNLPPVTPQYTDEEIDKAQAVEQAYVDKMVELAVEESKRPKGHWIIIDDCELFMAKCSECGEIVDSRMINKYPYCHCGAYMGGADETN